MEINFVDYVTVCFVRERICNDVRLRKAYHNLNFYPWYGISYHIEKFNGKLDFKLNW